MAKGSGRFRHRKLGFKTRINVEVGVVIEEDPLDVDLDIEDEKGHKGVETGVDKDEEGEVHLQAVIASTAAYVAQNTHLTAGRDKGKKREEAYIPTRTSQPIPDAEYDALYRPGYVDPISYIRFSDTVEDTQKGAVAYTMDEDDEDWLEDFNAQFAPGAKPRPRASSSAAPAGDDDVHGTPSGRGARNKSKPPPSSPAAGPSSALAGGTGTLDSLPPPTAPLSEDDFELVMEVFETVTDRKAPMAHVNLSLLPKLDDFDEAFLDLLRPELARLRPYVSEVYTHWKERRIARGGKSVIPQLDYDESNENNPYVCFRRRDVKTARKTRRSDQQNLERLVRLRNDLYAAHALLVKVQERERLKLEAVQLERAVFERRCEMRELKRRLNEPDGDEELLISRREKKRKRDEPGSGSLRLSLRKNDPNAISPAALVVPLDELQARKQRNDAILKQVERDLSRKRQADAHWEDWTDSAYLSKLPPTPARFFRSVEPVPSSIPFNGPNGRREALGFSTQYQPPLGRVRTSFRKRVGRGGRVLIDRVGVVPRRDESENEPTQRRAGSEQDSDATDDDEEEEDEWLAARRRERLKYDTDAGLDFPTAEEPTLVDDFDLQYLLRRVQLLKPADVQSLTLDSAYLDEAMRFVASDPDKNTPAPLVVGRPPQRPPLQMAPSQAAAGTPLGQAAAAAAAAQAAAAQAAAAQASGQSPNAAAYAQAQQQIASQRAMQLAQQQAMRKQQAAMAAAAAGGAGTPDQMRRTPSQSGAAGGGAVSPHGSQHSPLANGLPLPGVNVNGVVIGQDGKGQIVLPPGYNHGLPLSPLGSNGMSLPNQRAAALQGANGLPATSRLSAPPYSNPQALQLAIQQQQQQQQQAQLAAAAAAAAGGSPIPLQQLQPRPLSANGGVVPPPRPTSAASSNLSPHMGGGAVLPSGGALSPGGVPRVNGLATPPPGSLAKQRTSPIAQAAQYPQQQMQQLQQQMMPPPPVPAGGHKQMSPQYGGF
ncbi:hypothetical protein Rhopal_001194-T1 [Rhodotorula paludigena]|uniref:Enhancer of polycomb-like protein n=1 Tax=Rhodotorula paludigena TaxID=86838 RepID=A0AAV5GEB8_9BASI|nr:hypothetical protein Rhopal_001194-T1 [Rhodotorula paludigena]